MAPQSEVTELVQAWAALASQGGGPGWSSIPISAGLGRLRAGVRHPGSTEALLVGFGPISHPPGSQLPKGRGFSVTGVELGTDLMLPHWFVLSRDLAGSRELFEMMAVDIVRTVAGAASASENVLFHTFLSRIRAWQNFMERPGDSLLSLESQIGLIGELIALQKLLGVLPDPVFTVEAWQGPLDGVQDFFLGHGAIEVKATMAAHGFPAKISSLEQLDQAVRCPVFLAAVRLTLQTSGLTLPGWVDQLRATLGVSAARPTFENRLLHAGYFDGHREAYTTAFSHTATRVIELDEDFPSLVRSQIPTAILSATYEIDLDFTTAATVGWEQALHRVGII